MNNQEYIKRSDAYRIALHYGNDVAAQKIAELPPENVAPVVRCAVCNQNISRNERYAICDRDGRTHRPDWFCADGKEKL